MTQERLLKLAYKEASRVWVKLFDEVELIKEKGKTNEALEEKEKNAWYEMYEIKMMLEELKK